MTIEKPKPQVDSPDPEWPTLYPSQRQDIGPITINGSGNPSTFLSISLLIDGHDTLGDCASAAPHADG